MFRPIILALLIAAPAQAQSAKKPSAVAAKTPASSTKKPAPAATHRAPVRPAGKTTLSGVYNAEDAKYGKDMYASLCASCHTAASHTGPAFRKKWAGKSLADLFTFMRTAMPKNEPGSLAVEDYQALLSYLLQMNRMPAGKASLSTDSTELAKIRIDTLRPVRKGS